MKKITIILLGISILILTYIVFINGSSKNYDFDRITTAFLINYNKDKVNSIEVYNGNKVYYIINYDFKGDKYVGVLDKKEKLIYEVKWDDLATIDEKNKSIGYKNDKLIYEVKKETKNGYTYYYYDALSGEFINKIAIDK